MKSLLFGILLLPVLVNSQNKSKLYMEDSHIEKWTSAIVNLEVRSNYFTSKDYLKVNDDRSKGLITLEDYQKKTDQSYGDNYEEQHTFSGTAIYAMNKGRHYLITARHVIEDVFHKQPGNIFAKIFLVENGSSIVKSGNVPDDKLKAPGTLITASSHDVKSFEFSPTYDLAIIDLDHFEGVGGKYFVKILNDKGYKPINTSDMDATGDIKKNETIYAFGFPQESEIHNIQSSENRYFWRSRSYSIPFVTNGQFKEIQGDSDLFSGNIFVYHGFSGGPIAIKDKLVGIINGANFLQKNTSNSNLTAYILLQNRFTKAHLILPLIEILEKRFP